MPLDTPALKRKAADDSTATVEWFNDLGEKLGERHAPKIRALGEFLDENHWCPNIKDIRDSVRKDEMEAALVDPTVGASKGALKTIERYMGYVFPDLSGVPDSAVVVKPDSRSKGCILPSDVPSEDEDEGEEDNN